ncbi:MAG: hypothetical protein HUJ54_09920 [Erysipelotrichaceae bacterium]|nr:hypothetical protein [Erysipelotrichaceae bacterium]
MMKQTNVQTTNTDMMNTAMMASTMALEFDKRMIHNRSVEENIQITEFNEPASRDELEIGKFYIADKESRYLTDGIAEREVFKVLGVFDEEHFWGSVTFKKACVMNCRNGQMEEIYCHHYAFFHYSVN